MSALVVYDSTYGNTETLARRLADALPEARVLHVSRAGTEDLRDIDLLIVGSPTQGGRPTAALTKLLQSIPENRLTGCRVTAFDTRLASDERGLGLRILMKVIGYAAPRIARTLQSKGGQLAAPPQGFIVRDTEGPLKDGELERAARWASELLNEGESAG